MAEEFTDDRTPGPRMSWLKKRLRKLIPKRKVQAPGERLPRDASVIKPVIEPVPDGTWVLKARRVNSRPDGVPEQEAFYANADVKAWLWIRTVSVDDTSNGIEEDEVRAHREILNFYAFPQRDEWHLRRPPLRRQSDPPDITSSWSTAAISVDGTPVAIRTARVGDQGWIGWWTHADKIVDIQSDTVSVSNVNLVSAP